MRLISFVYFLFVFGSAFAQFESDANYTRVVFYNVENLFDNIDDEGKRDEEYLPSGDRFWTDRKVKDKLHRMSKAILSTGAWNPPHIIGLCEVENRNILNMLVGQTPMRKYDYQIIHQESPDNRGIDVALLYLERKFKPVYTEFIPVIFPNDPDRKTRDVLYAKGLLDTDDTLHVFVNHWPSRWGGQMESEPGRLLVASLVRKKVEQIWQTDSLANIVIMGDFNDEPNNRSIYDVLRAREKEPRNKLINLMIEKEGKEGTHKYDGKWGILDQIVVSKNLIFTESDESLKVKNKEAVVHRADFLLEKDEKDLGVKPFRTFIGFTYHGGFSDHLPVYIDLVK